MRILNTLRVASKNNLRIIHLFLFTFIFMGLAFAQENLSQQYSIKNGLPSNENYFLFSDSKGYIWICTDNGLARYNANSFLVFDVSHGMPDNTVFEVCEDYRGNIWFRTFNGKIGYIQNDEVHLIGANKKIESFILEGIVSSFYINPKGVLYLGKKNTSDNSFLAIEPPYESENVRDIVRDNNSSKGMRILLPDSKGLAFSDKRGRKEYYRVEIFDALNHCLLYDSIQLEYKPLYTKVIRDKQKLLIILNNNLMCVDLNKKTTKKISFETDLVAVSFIENYQYSISDRNGKVFKTDSALASFEEINNYQGISTHWIKDYQGGQWRSTLDQGTFYTSAFKSYKLEWSKLDENAITQVQTINDTSVLCGTLNGTIFTIASNGKTVEIEKESIQKLKNQTGSIQSLFPAEPNEMIISGNQGSLIYQANNKKTTPIWSLNQLPVTAIAIAQTEQEIIGIGIGNYFSFNSQKPYQLNYIKKSNERLSCIAYDKLKKEVYIGSIKGLFKFNPEKAILEKELLIQSRIEDLIIYGNKIIAATKDRGIIVIENNRADTIDMRKGLISNFCKRLLVKDNYLWVCTNKGLSRIAFISKNKKEIQNFSISQFNESGNLKGIFACKNFIGTYDDYNFYLLNTNNITQQENKLQLEGVFLNSNKVDPNKKIKIKPGNSVLEIRVAALFYNVSGIIYRYKIKATDKQWIYTKDHTLTLNNLSPDQYLIQIQAQKPSSEWVNLNQSLEVEVIAPFYTNRWFILGIIACSAIIIFIAIRYRYLQILKTQKQKTEEQIERLELEGKVLRNQMNPHFIFNALNGIQNLILSQKNDNAYSYLQKLARLLRINLESTRMQSITLQHELEFINNYLEIESERFSQDFEYSIDLSLTEEASRIEIPQMMIQPLVENAIWHGLLQKEGIKKLNIRCERINAKTLLFEISDNGLGFTKKATDKKVHQSMALEIINKRLKLFSEKMNENYRLEIMENNNSTTFDQGLTVKILIPIFN